MGDMLRHPWLGVEMRHLATLVAVARTGSFRGAAAELGYVQSAVSQHISRLEEAVGTPLVERRRGRRGVALTAAGRVLFERSAGIVAQLAAARTDIDASPSELRLAVVGDGGLRLLAELLPAIRAAVPEVRLHVAELAGDVELAAALAHGTAELGIGAPGGDVELVRVPLLDDPYVVLVRGASRLAAVPVVVSADLAGEAVFAAAGVPFEGAERVVWSAAMPALVASGAGVGLLPRSEVPAGEDGLVAVATAGLLAPRQVALCWPAARRRTGTIERVAAAAARPRLARAA